MFVNVQHKTTISCGILLDLKCVKKRFLVQNFKDGVNRLIHAEIIQVERESLAIQFYYQLNRNAID